MIPAIAFAAILALAAVAAALHAGRAPGADYLRLACALAIALALGDVLAAAQDGALLALASALTPIAAALASTALALCVRLSAPPHTAFAVAALVLATLSGLAAAATGALALAFAPLFASACAMLAVSARAWRAGRRSLHGIAAAFALVAGASAYLTGGAEGRTAFALFLSVALFGVALALNPQARLSKPSRAMPRPLP